VLALPGLLLLPFFAPWGTQDKLVEWRVLLQKF
jgi:hypothetical protein